MSKPKPNVSWVGSTLGDRYSIESFIDQGGMSAVYEAYDPNLKRSVAIKIIHPHLSLDPKFVQRFEQEASSVANLRHSNIVQAYDFDHDQNTYYMVMEYIPGQTLKQVLKAYSAKNERLPLAETIRIMSSVCDAVEFAHQNGMIHRDLKPANVMLTPEGRVVLMDFGVVRMLGSGDMTATGATIGTAKYMSPEQARGDKADERSDIYALGVMLYEMVAGQPPFDADTTVGILMKHVNEPVPNIRDVQREIPNDLAEIIEKSLAKNPANRYQSAEHIAVALRLLNRLELASDSIGDSQSTVSSRAKRQDTDISSVKVLSKVLENSSTPVAKTAQPASKSNKLVYWIIGGGAMACILLFVAAGLLTYLFSPLLNGIQASETSTLPTSEGMAQVGAAAYSVGLETADRDHVPQQNIELAEYWIDQREVSNTQYADFLAATNQPPPITWIDGKFPADQGDFPATGITWDQAKAYCGWANKRLPAEAEWEVAARGVTGRLYPWGNNQQAVQLPGSGTYAVGSKSTNQSPFGVFDMAGNVWEWVDQPYAPVPNDQRILRGGANDFLKDMAYRLAGDPSIPTMIASAGIRCAADADKVNVIAMDTIAENVYLEDTFINPNSGWPILAEGAFFYGYHPPDYYHVQVGTPNNFAAISHPPNFDNVTVVADVLVDHTSPEGGDFRYGVILRRVAEDQFYAFTIAPRAQTWHILKSTPDGLEVLEEGEVSSLRGLAPAGFTPDTTDNLQVDANGSGFVFHINNQTVAEISDPDYASGEVGFFVETFDESLVHAHFDKLTVRQVESTAAELSNTVRLADKFTNPDSGWPTEDIEGKPYRYGYHPPDYYHLEPRAANEHIAVTWEQSYQDAGVETEVFVDHTTTEDGDFRYGLVLRRVADDQFYAFTVSPRTQTWQVLKSSAAGLETLAEGKSDTLQGMAPPGFTPDKGDIIRVDALGSAFAFQINGNPVVQISDADYVDGEIGFYAENLDETLSHIHFETLTIGEVDPKAMAASSPTPASEPAK